MNAKPYRPSWAQYLAFVLFALSVGALGCWLDMLWIQWVSS